MKPFIHDDFLLQTGASRELFHGYAKPEPIFDYHCHVSPQQIADNHQFSDLADIWIGGDHYKWRAMRANGVDERFCTGDATPHEKFMAWAAAMPHLVGNPLYHWSHLELKRYFGIEEIFNTQSAPAIWERANARLPSLRVHDILSANKVAVVCTTDDPADSLSTHERIRGLGIKTRVYPAFRPDKALGVAHPEAFNPWVERLAHTVGSKIKSFGDFMDALKSRHDAFHAFGCRLSDHGLETALSEPCTEAQAQAVFKAARSGRGATPEESARFGSYLMLAFGHWDAHRGWTKQLHLGALRSTNTRLLSKLGPDTGFDSIGDLPQARPLARYLDALDTTGQLPRMVIYNLNPADNYVFATMAGNFQDGSVAGKVQFGSGWWFLDQKDGMIKQLNALSNMGLLSRFVGMLTDSRSFLSFPRHEYFRRVLCNLFGQEMENGELPMDLDWMGGIIQDICFRNAREYFGWNQLSES